MTRYMIGPKRADFDDDFYPVALPQFQVEVSDARPTGIVDHLGRDIWVGPEPIGFRFGEPNQ